MMLLSACTSGRWFDTIRFERPIDPSLISNETPEPVDQQSEFDLSEWFGSVPLDGEVPILRVDERIDLVVLEATNTNVFVDWRLPGPEGHLYLRFSDRMFPADSCPTNGTESAVGAVELDALDGYMHPIRQITLWPYTHTRLDVTSPQLDIGARYYLQGCELDFETGLFTGAETNTVVIEIASALPDLVIREVRMLGRSPSALGKLFIRVEDLNATMEREIRADSFPYTVSIGGGFRDPPLIEYQGTANLLANGSAWIIPGAETADPSDDPRVPDDGLFYDVRVNINNDRTGSITIPEASYFNNSSTARLRTRAQPVVLGFDSMSVVENCDAVSPGDWLMLLEIDVGSDELRLVADGTIDVDDNSAGDVKQGYLLEGTNISNTVRARLGFIDCDLDLLSGFVLPLGFIWSGSTIEKSCGGEEAFEVGGGNDLVGFAQAGLSGRATLEPITTVTAVASEEDCGPAPFTATFKVMTLQQALDDGYDPDNIIRFRLR